MLILIDVLFDGAVRENNISYAHITFFFNTKQLFQQAFAMFMIFLARHPNLIYRKMNDFNLLLIAFCQLGSLQNLLLETITIGKQGLQSWENGLQSGEKFWITKWGKIGLLSGAAFWITEWGKWITKWGRDYKVGQGLQSGSNNEYLRSGYLL